MKVTLREVAKQSGLSVTTVSRALNGHDDVAEETKQAVQSVADALGYVPNLSARRLKTEKADAIGLILPKENLRFSDPFFSDLLSGMVEQSAEYGLELNITTSLDTEKIEETYLNYIRSRRVDGFIIVRAQHDDPRIRMLQAHDFPFVTFGHEEGVSNYPFVDDDSKMGIGLVIDHLVALGHQRIAYITEPRRFMKAETRLQGFLQGMARWGLTAVPNLIIESNFRQRSGYASTQELLDRDNPPTAIVAANDLLAIGAINAARERGLTVGKDISITGFDDILLAEYTSPPLTTVHVSPHQMGQLLCQTLYDVMNNPSAPPPHKILPPTLIIRGSTGPI
ncbi:MAG: LacI family DNA-binding transcriptional regulator [Anaerolineales bacterium]|nr:LacI family DNA-binding transcriptional regulator [Anaerolineales bacterium]